MVTDSEEIGVLFTIYGLVGMLGQFLVFPPVARRFGVLRCFRVVLPIFPLIYLLIPFTALLPTDATRRSAACILMLFKAMLCVFAFPCSTIMITNSARSLRILGTLNGVSVSVSAMGRAAGPAVGGAVFSLAVKRGYVIVPWWIFAIMAALGALPLCFVVEGKGFGEDENMKRDGEVADDDDDDDEEFDVNDVRSNGSYADDDSNHTIDENYQSQRNTKARRRRQSSRKKNEDTLQPKISSGLTSRQSSSTQIPVSQSTSNSNTIVGDDYDFDRNNDDVRDDDDDDHDNDDDNDDKSSIASSNRPLLQRDL